MSEKQTFAGEDEHSGYASPRQDMVAAAFLVILCVWVMIESVRLKNPGTLATAPGMLPFLTAASLCLMALGLGYLAIVRHRHGETVETAGDATDHLRTVLLIGLIGAYLAALELVKFDYSAVIGGMRLGYGSFELMTTILLTVLLAVFWQPRIGPCLLVSAIWSTALAAAFRYIFVIPLPGAF